MASSKNKQKKMLIIGDSISIGYTPFVRKHLSKEIIVEHNIGNAQHSGVGLKNIDKWLGTQKWDIIQFNWGLWDLCYRSKDSKIQGNRDKVHGEVTTLIEEYKSNLNEIIKIIKKKSDAKLIFVSTTYVPEKELGRFQEDVNKYNEVAKKIMKENNILINDIYAMSFLIHKKYGKGIDDVHYTKKGYEKLGELISNFIKDSI
ncbi:SGNH/GDSL hydrolase family protein [Polaribacter sp. Hel_I_88]|uniref:SGNH/GDSL hydrolase family protein n=1 Tax=Polaribacter sp. Hel_I_88 TaxID=1250006 RepID=UPI001E55B007|nr:SGNH/GDSL hydrolase family protein [Polaribacter sp. Hel_I_88]